LPKAQRASTKRLKRLPPRVYDRLQAKLLPTGQAGEAGGLGALTPKQVTVLDDLLDRFSAIRARHGQPNERHFNDEKVIDGTLQQDDKDFARAVRAAEKIGLFDNGSVIVPKEHVDLVQSALPALKAAQGWLARFDDDGRPKHRRLTPPKKAAPKRRAWATFAGRIARQAHVLHEKGYSAERIRQAIIPMLRRVRGKDAADAEALADTIAGMTGRGWSKRLKALCD
jgi:hypothetical protein